MTPTKSPAQFVPSIVPVTKLENSPQGTKGVGSRSCVKSTRTDNTEDIAGNIKDGLKTMERAALLPGSDPSHEQHAKGGTHPVQSVSTRTTLVSERHYGL